MPQSAAFCGFRMDMKYKPLRRDLTEFTEKCHFCLRPLHSMKAFVFEIVETGETVYSGPVCAEKFVESKEILKELPDLTKFTLAMKEGGKRTAGHEIVRGARRENSKRKKALEYLELREGKLAPDFSTSYKPMKAYYLKGKNSQLSDDEIQHILNIENKAPENLRLENLQRCYNYVFWIDIALAKIGEKAQDFFPGVRSYLVNNFKITPKQKEGINNWLKNQKGIPQLK
ncbi:MAG: hypothetical protein GY820_14150 [Gammaproteobacteria bacterium]|nr:hypothetical protein [Gammaproteobacteria bacterium]